MLRCLRDFWNLPKSSSKCLGLLISRACFIILIVVFMFRFGLLPLLSTATNCHEHLDESTAFYSFL